MPIYEVSLRILRFPEGSPAEIVRPVLTVCPECGKDSVRQATVCRRFSTEGQRLVRH